MRKTVFIPVKLIEQANQDNWLRTLGYFVKMKSLYFNNTHYKYSLRSLAAKMGCSSSGLHIHVTRLVDMGLITNHCGNITFLGYGKLKRMFGDKFIGVPVTDLKNQLTYLRGQIIRFNLKQQDYRIKKAGIQKSTRGFVPFKQKGNASMNYTGLSAYGVGLLFGLSEATGSRLRTKLASYGLLKLKRRFHLIAENACYGLYLAGKYEKELPPYAKYKNGNIIIERTMQMEYVAN